MSSNDYFVMARKKGGSGSYVFVNYKGLKSLTHSRIEIVDTTLNRYSMNQNIAFEAIEILRKNDYETVVVSTKGNPVNLNMIVETAIKELEIDRPVSDTSMDALKKKLFNHS